MSGKCPRCQRGREACQWCERLDDGDHEAICDCGLVDFGDHLFDCAAREPYHYVVAADYDAAELRRGERA